MLQDRTHRWLLGVVGVLLVATIVGMVALWPAPRELSDEPPLDDRYTAVLREVEVIAGEDDPVAGGFGDEVVLEAELLEGPDAGTTTTIRAAAEGYPDFRVGDRVELQAANVGDGTQNYFVADFQRLPALGLLIGVFVLAVLAIGRFHGLRSLLGLALSLLIVVQFVVPAILAGASPFLVALVGSIAVMIVTLYLAHGVNPMTTAAIVGTSVALLLTILLGVAFIEHARITGFASEEAGLVRFAVEGIDLRGLVLAGLIIAALGVLDDVTVSQASTVFALHDTDRTLPWRTLFARAMKVGRDHIASVVNTLFLAYAGASLTLLVLFSTGPVPVLELVNSEILAVEIVKTVVGSLGLIAAVPLTTALAATVAVRRPPDAPSLAHGHDHGHGRRHDPQGATVVTAADDAGPHPSRADRRTEEERVDDAWMRYLREGPGAGEGSGAGGPDESR
ncbi:YibE/F family protein [Egicoccus halophilus]|uniref:Membrane protein n=1 Tax=Egicoccus halophilus TaxID=1670830 RepID=A0A8J3ETG7_9ACTN|nr:YibE/F family protein [Egicoccus halophilus]GGI09585.1 membrane protein [Egicoccus halophilus]